METGRAGKDQYLVVEDEEFEMLDLATHIVNGKSGHFDPTQFEDRFETALVDLLKKKEAGEKIAPAKAGPAPRVVNLMDAADTEIL